MSRWSGSLETSSRTAGVGLPNSWAGIQPRSSREQPQAGQPNTVSMERYNFYIYININFICDHMKELQTF